MPILRHNFAALRNIAEQRAVLLQQLLFGYAAVALVGIIFLSPLKVFGLTVLSLIFFVTFWKPRWMAIVWFAYLPLEPFLLKWVPDELYVGARYGSEGLLYLLLIAALAHRLWQPKRLRAREFPLLPTFLFVCSIIGVSALVNLVPPVQAVLGARMIIRFVLVFYLIVLLRPDDWWVRSVGRFMAVVVGLQIIVGISQAVVGAPLDQFLLPTERKTFGAYQLTGGTTQFWDPGERVFGTMGRYDQLGTFLALAALLVVAMLYYRTWPEERRVWGYAALFALLITLTLTYSRSAWFGFILGFLFLALVLRRDRLVLAGAGTLVVVLVAYAGANGLLVNRLTESSSQTVVERFFESLSVERFRGEYYGLGRVFWMYHTFASVIPAAPLFGFGPASYGGGAVAALGNATVYDQLGLPFGVYGTEGYIDNNWLSLWGELGTVGIAAYLLWYGGLWRTAVRVAETSTNKETRTIAAATAAMFVAVAVNASLATMLEVRTLAPYLWAMAGLVAVRAQKEKGDNA